MQVKTDFINGKLFAYSAWMYMEWLSQEQNLFVLQNGIEGVNHRIGSDGYPVMINLEGTGRPKMMNHNPLTGKEPEKIGCALHDRRELKFSACLF